MDTERVLITYHTVLNLRDRIDEKIKEIKTLDFRNKNSIYRLDQLLDELICDFKDANNLIDEQYANINNKVMGG